MQRAIGIVSLALIFAASGMAQQKASQDNLITVGNTQRIKIPEGVTLDAAQSHAAADNGIFRERRAAPGKAETGAFYGSVASLWVATALDIQSSKGLDPTRYREVNVFGGTGGQIATSAIATGAAFLIQRYGRGRGRWLASALLAGASAGHYYGAIHNYSLR